MQHGDSGAVAVKLPLNLKRVHNAPNVERTHKLVHQNCLEQSDTNYEGEPAQVVSPFVHSEERYCFESLNELVGGVKSQVKCQVQLDHYQLLLGYGLIMGID